VAFYLLTGQYSNMIGVYRLPLAYIAGDTRMDMEAVKRGMRAVIDAGFCTYDEKTQTVWVYEMARYQIEDTLKPGDNRIKNIVTHLEAIKNNPFKAAFYDRYAVAFNMPRLNDAPAQAALPAAIQGASEGACPPPMRAAYEASRAVEQKNRRKKQVEHETPDADAPDATANAVAPSPSHRLRLSRARSQSASGLSRSGAFTRP
jgi:hypothetical protein